MNSVLKTIKERHLELRKMVMKKVESNEETKTRVNVIGVLLNECAYKDKESDEEIYGVIFDFIKNNNLLIDNESNDEKISRLKVENEELESFLPSQLSEKELDEVISQCIVDQEIKTPAEIKKVMAYMEENYSGRYDKKSVGKLVKQKL